MRKFKVPASDDSQQANVAMLPFWHPGGMGVPITSFLVFAFPCAAGRGVIVAILDTGVDPAAAGMQVCPDGRPKVVDLIEATGSGDVDTRTVAKPSGGFGTAGVEIVGLSGRTLRLNAAWSNPSGAWRIGAKRAFDVFAGPLKSRVSARMRADADKAIAEMVAAAAR